MLGPVGQTILDKLGAALAPVAIRLDDESHRHAGHAGARADGESHFALSIAAPAFAGKRAIERHRMVNAALKEELKSRVHALAIRAMPAELEFIGLVSSDRRLHALLAECGLPTDDIVTENSILFGLSNANALAACGGLELTNGPALLRSLAVAPGHRGQGHGQAMALKLIAEAHARGASEIWLLTETTQDFFAGLGFAPVPRSEAPAAVKATSQFMGTRCSNAMAMKRAI